jgi:hypothetical protein
MSPWDLLLIGDLCGIFNSKSSLWPQTTLIIILPPNFILQDSSNAELLFISSEKILVYLQPISVSYVPGIN